MTFRVILLPSAEADIEVNARWWAEHHSTEQAVRWFETVYQQLQTLVALPESHGLSAENGDFPYELRDKLVGLGSRPSYRAVFTIRNETVYVLTVRRADQDTLRPNEIDAPPVK